MPFGLTNAPGTFERLMDKIMRGLQYEICLIYLDDVIVKSVTFDDHLKYLSMVFDRFRTARLKLSPKKCNIFQTKVSFLGHIVSRDGVSTDPNKIKAVTEWPRPVNVKQVRSFTGLCSYYRKFIRNFATIAKPLHKLTEKNITFSWDSDCEASFNSLKKALTEAPILAYPEPNGKFVLDTDASSTGIGGVLSQVQDNEERVIGYFSRSMSKSERRYCVTRKELLAVVMSIKHFHHYLLGVPFIVRSDHGSLRWFLNFKNLEGQLARWSELLGTYNFDLVYRAGRLHNNADGLSRRPCENCSYCTRVEAKDERQEQQLEPDCECFRRARTRSKAQKENCDHAKSWVDVKAVKDIKEAQEEDQFISIVIGWLKRGKTRPAWRDISKYGTTVKAYWAQWDRLCIKEGLLYRTWFEVGSKTPIYQLVLPECMREEALKHLHNQAYSGHLGIKRTLARARRRFYWVNYRKDVASWCRKCPECQKRNPPNKSHQGPMAQDLIAAPFEKVGMDILGPLPETDLGNKYILILSDYFTKWVESYPMSDQEAITIVKIFVKEFICRYGSPNQIHTDQGSQFESALFQGLCDYLDIEKTRTTPYHPQSDGLVERFNRTLEAMLTKVIDGDQKTWDNVLPLVMLAYRSSVHESINETPARMLFGRNIQLPCDLLMGRPPENAVSKDCNIPYVEALRNQLSELHEIARENMVQASNRQKKNYDKRINAKSYKIGESVFMHNIYYNFDSFCAEVKKTWQSPF